MSLALLLLTACIHDLSWRDSSDTAPPDAPPPTLADIAAGGGSDGAFIRFDGLVAGTGLTRDGRTFFLQTPDGGAGLRVDLAHAGTIGPLAPGAVLTLRVGPRGVVECAHVAAVAARIDGLLRSCEREDDRAKQVRRERLARSLAQVGDADEPVVAAGDGVVP